MPLRFYRRFRAGPFRLNFSKSGMSYSFGGRHAWLTFGQAALARGRHPCQRQSCRHRTRSSGSPSSSSSALRYSLPALLLPN
jgi:hypothetical protein